jgi:hypothetical protein
MRQGVVQRGARCRQQGLRVHATVPGSPDDAPVVYGDGRIDQITAQRPEPRQSAILVCAGEPTETDDVGGQDRCKLPLFRHLSPAVA